MKLHCSLLAAALLAVGSTSAFAQSTGDVSIGGTILPNSCTVTMANAGVIDFGVIASSTLNQSTNKAIGTRSVAVAIACSASTRLALTATDNRTPSLLANSFQTYGLGRTSGGASIGWYEMHWASVRANGAGVTPMGSHNLSFWTSMAGEPWHKANWAGSTMYRGFGGSASGPAALTTADFTLNVSAALHSRNQLALTKDEAIDGSATIEIVYL